MKREKVNTVKVGKITFGLPQKIVLIAGPCVIESEKSTLAHAAKVCAIARAEKISVVFKASYDKANRTSIRSYRGPGIDAGLKILEKVKKRYRVPILSDVHSVSEVKQAASVLDIIQIPAFLSRQTDLIVAAAKTKKVVNIKKGQFVSPWEVRNIIEKVYATRNKKVLITERGYSFGYNNLVSDFRAIPIVRAMGCPVIFDATHSVQMPGGMGNKSGGAREFIPTLARCAVAAGADGIFIEVHQNPAKALCDGANSLILKDLTQLLRVLKAIKRVV